MNREKTKDILEAIGVVALIASLIFVGIETRNGAIQAELNTEAIEMAAYQELIRSITDMNTLAIQTPELSSAVKKVNTGQIEMSEQEESLLDWWLWSRLRYGDLAYFQFQRGAIDENRLRSALAPLFPTISSPYGRQEWQWRQRVFAPEYRDYINRIIDEMNDGDGIYYPYRDNAN